MKRGDRDYGPTTATFLSPDPLGVGAEPEGRPSSGNLYAYVVPRGEVQATGPLGLCGRRRRRQCAEVDGGSGSYTGGHAYCDR